MVILILDAFLLPIVRAVDPYDWFMRRVVGPKQPTQRAMNRFWIGSEWTIAERYTDVGKTIFVGMFYAAAVPAGLWVTGAALVTTREIKPHLEWGPDRTSSVALGLARRFRLPFPPPAPPSRPRGAAAGASSAGASSSLSFSSN